MVGLNPTVLGLLDQQSNQLSYTYRIFWILLIQKQVYIYTLMHIYLPHLCNTHIAHNSSFISDICNHHFGWSTVFVINNIILTNCIHYPYLSTKVHTQSPYIFHPVWTVSSKPGSIKSFQNHTILTYQRKSRKSNLIYPVRER